MNYKILFPFALAVMLLTGCLKNAEQLSPGAPVLSDTTQNIKTVLASGPYHIFYAAFKKAGLDTAMPVNETFTVFAPTDAAFNKMGITLESLASISVDSLNWLLRYHIVRGAFSDESLQTTRGNITAPALLQKKVYDPAHGDKAYQYYLFLDKKGSLLVNGNPVNKGEAAQQTANGYIYSLDSVLIAPTQTVWDIISSRPELARYYRACQIDDSTNISFGWNGTSLDSVLYGSYDYNNAKQRAPLTVLAPVNSAFDNSPFATDDAMINYAAQLDYFYYNSMFFAVIRGQLIGNGLAAQLGYTGYELFYNDFLEIPDINNPASGYNYMGMFPMFDENYNVTINYVKFQPEGNTVSINWGSTYQFGPAHILPGGKNIACINGVVHEVDKLFLLQ